jgi:hypothetical protein
MIFYFGSLLVADQPSKGEQQIEQIGEYVHHGVDFLIRMAAEHPNEALTALSTTIIAAFTIVLARSTTKLWRAGELHSERQLRAYVGIVLTRLGREPLVQLITDQRPSADIIVKNFGQSPAYDVSISVNIAPGDYPLTSTLPELIPKGSRGILHPGEEIHIVGHGEHPLGEEAGRLQTEHKTRRLYFYGQISYRDIFRKHHTTRFRLHTASQGATVQRFEHSDDDNDAD